MSRLVIFGTGGCGRDLVGPVLRHLRSVHAATGEHRELVLADDEPSGPVLGLPVFSPCELRDDDEVIIALGSSAARAKVAPRFGRIASFLAPTVLIGPNVELGEGAVLSDHVMVTASTKIGRHFQANYYSYVAHDCFIGDFVTFAPRVSCNGNVHIGNGAYIGTGAVIRQGTPEKPLTIGAGAVVGMGAVVTKDVAPGATVVGNPAKAR